MTTEKLSHALSSAMIGVALMWVSLDNVKGAVVALACSMLISIINGEGR